jgi:hypothetical protein
MRKFLSLLFVLIMAGAFIAACGGDDDDNTNASDDQEQVDNDNGGDDDAADSGDDDSGDDDSGDDDSGDSSGSDELDELLAMQADAHIKIVYEATGDMATDSDTITVIQDGKDRSAWISGNSSFYNIDGKSISCDSLDSEPTCTELPEGLGDLAGLGPMTFFNAIGQGLLQAGDGLDGLDKHDEEIAGRDAVCIDYDYGALLGGLGELGDLADDESIDTDASAKVCVDEETGYLLEFSGEGDGSSGSLKAVEVSEPSDADFEPPAEVEENPLGDLEGLDLDELVPDDTSN